MNTRGASAAATIGASRRASRNRVVRMGDYFVIQGVVLMLIVSLAVLLFLVDLAYPLIDPRIRR